MIATAVAFSENDLVEWDSSIDGTNTGAVRHLTRSIENGQAFAVVEVDHELPGILECVPLNQLRKTKFGKPRQEASK
ncbi:hypothetical protein [Noviherbaspirillum denitrificans]|uniref:Hypervirulence associated protein TUDOR domain-containing protein n=1 Tax=Noviherbaspirillum denitrificans TaxID=1968433 RepID=A0A254T706_9BURK|nr:hypothetical protein [Noviherbaspirillum denitrificans]OWW18431.1 hypothetical protein AYR66_01120 [Noviherbaspirillum denitrificans]OWW19395.1 hypothetical protein AYR66_07605 [Noviherbaspirillum denitrificans]